MCSTNYSSIHQQQFNLILIFQNTVIILEISFAFWERFTKQKPNILTKHGFKHRDNESTKMTQMNIYSTKGCEHFLEGCTLCLIVSLERNNRLTSRKSEDGSEQFTDFWHNSLRQLIQLRGSLWIIESLHSLRTEFLLQTSLPWRCCIIMASKDEVSSRGRFLRRNILGTHVLVFWVNQFY